MLEVCIKIRPYLNQSESTALSWNFKSARFLMENMLLVAGSKMCIEDTTCGNATIEFQSSKSPQCYLS